MQQLRVKIRTGVPGGSYSESFKKQVVREYERGAFSKKQIQLKYGIRGKSMLLDWCSKYGRFAYHEAVSNGRPMKDRQKQRIRELEKKLRLPSSS
jgi:transposase